MKIYTKSGDKGETSLFTGQRVPKNDPYIMAIGAVDECNCAIGVALAYMPNNDNFATVRQQLQTIQHALFDLGATLATPETCASNAKLKKTRFDNLEIELLEQWIDEFDSHLEKLTTFILPGGHPSGAMLHLARSTCRKAERYVTPINTRSDVPDNVMIYLNRLSDYLFVLSRFVNAEMQCPETLWEPHKLSH